MDTVFFSRNSLKNEIWLPPLTIGEEDAQFPACIIDLLHAPFLMISWCFPKKKLCFKKLVSANNPCYSDYPLDVNLENYVLRYLLCEKTICGECKMPMTFHMMNFVSILGIIRLVCRRTLHPNLLSGDDRVIWTWERSRPDLNGHLFKETCQRTQVSSKQGKTRFKIFVQELLSQHSDKLKYFGKSDWTSCFWYDKEGCYSIIPPGTLAIENYQVEEPRHDTPAVLLKLGSFGSDNNYQGIPIDINSTSSEDQLGKFIAAALMYLHGNVRNEIGKEEHPKVSSNFYGNGSEFSVTCLHAPGFSDLRGKLYYQEKEYIGSLHNCKSWKAEGGKSRAVFVKTEDERFIIKEIQDVEFWHLKRIAPAYFDHFSSCKKSAAPSYLVPILGLYMIKKKTGSKTTHVKVVVMQNLMFGCNNRIAYDLKGCHSSRCVSNLNASVLLDGNYLTLMPFRAIFLSRAAKMALEASLIHDTSFLEVHKIMDYSLLVLSDREGKVVTLGIIDYLRPFSCDKNIEYTFKFWFGTHQPTVLPVGEYRERFIRVIMDYFIVIPGQ